MMLGLGFGINTANTTQFREKIWNDSDRRPLWDKAEQDELRGDYQSLVTTLTVLSKFCDEHAEYQLGLLYMEGHDPDIAQDYEEAVKWLTSSHHRGYLLATLQLGDLYTYSENMNNEEKAQNFYKSIEYCLTTCRHTHQKQVPIIADQIVNNFDQYKNNPLVMRIAALEVEYIERHHQDKPEVIELIKEYIANAEHEDNQQKEFA